jgi:hypothetical protein
MRFGSQFSYRLPATLLRRQEFGAGAADRWR